MGNFKHSVGLIQRVCNSEKHKKKEIIQSTWTVYTVKQLKFRYMLNINITNSSLFLKNTKIGLQHNFVNNMTNIWVGQVIYYI